MSDELKLKTCPFCGGEPILQEHEAHAHSPALKAVLPDLPDHTGSWTIECCDVGMIKDTREAVIAAWNTRRPTPEQSGEAREPIGYVNERMLSVLAAGTVSCTHISPKRTEFQQIAIYTEAK